MPTYSPQMLAETALRKLGVLPNGQTADAADVALVADKIEGLLEELSKRKTYHATDVLSITPAAFDHIATLLAARCTSEFQIAGQTEASLLAKAMKAERDIRALSDAREPFSPLVADYN